MSKKSRKQRERKRAKIGVKNVDSELLLKQQKNNEARKDSMAYLDNWQNQKENEWKFQKSK